jgi:hypothetical protein
MTMLEVSTATKSRRRGSLHDISWVMKRNCKPKAVAPREPSTPAEIFCYDDLIQTLRDRVEELGISRESVSALAHVPDGYAQKVLSLSGKKRIGLQSLAGFLDALSVKLVLVENPAALERNMSRYKQRDDAHFRSAKARHDPTKSLVRWAAARDLTVVFGDDAK